MNTKSGKAGIEVTLNYRGRKTGGQNFGSDETPEAGDKACTSELRRC